MMIFLWTVILVLYWNWFKESNPMRSNLKKKERKKCKKRFARQLDEDKRKRFRQTSTKYPFYLRVCVCVCVYFAWNQKWKTKWRRKKKKREEKKKRFGNCCLLVFFFGSICRWRILDLNVFITGSPRKGGTGFYWVLIGYTGLDKVVMGFTGFYWALPSLSGFSWV